MMTDNALANFGNSLELLRGGDTGKRRAEHRSFLLLWFTHIDVRGRLFLLLIGGSASVIIVLIGAILKFIQVKVGTLTGGRLIMSRIILAIIVVYFTLFPPDFILGQSLS